MGNEHHLPDLTPEQALELGEVDLAIEDVLRSLDESLADLDLDPVDRSLIIQHVRWAFINGWLGGKEESLRQLGLTPPDE